MKKSLSNKLKGSKFLIVSHIFATGPALDLEEYLKDKVKSLFFIGHPFSFRKEIQSFHRIYKKGKLVHEGHAPSLKLPEVGFYFKDAFLTFWWVLTQREKYNYYIGSDNFSAYLGLILKKLGKVDEVILYTIDYLPQRFSNAILNNVYHFFDKQCLKNCKIVWNVSPVMAEAREKYANLRIKESVPQILVPLGMWHKRIPKLPLNKKERYQIAFMGHILDKQGLDIVVKALPKILKKVPKARLLIIGTGPDEDRLKGIAKKLGVDRKIEFTGYVEDHKDVEGMLSRSTVAVATYRPDPKSFTNWADPGKLKNYLSAGLPIFLTAVPSVAKELEKEKCAIIVQYNENELAEKVGYLLKDTKLLNTYSKNAIKFASKYDWDIVFANALSSSLD